MQFLTVHVCMPISVHVEAREGYQLYHTITLFLAYSLRECLYMNQKLNILATQCWPASSQGLPASTPLFCGHRHMAMPNFYMCAGDLSSGHYKITFNH